VKRAECETNHLFPMSAEVKKAWSYPSTALCALKAYCKELQHYQSSGCRCNSVEYLVTYVIYVPEIIATKS